jgi:hypothetical protein
MAKTKAERKAELMAAMEQEIDHLMEWESHAAKVTMTDIEDQVLAARRRISERLASDLAQARVERVETALPPPATRDSDARLQRKGKKTGPARRASGS